MSVYSNRMSFLFLGVTLLFLGGVTPSFSATSGPAVPRYHSATVDDIILGIQLGNNIDQAIAQLEDMAMNGHAVSEKLKSFQHYLSTGKKNPKFQERDEKVLALLSRLESQEVAHVPTTMPDVEPVPPHETASASESPETSAASSVVHSRANSTPASPASSKDDLQDPPSVEDIAQMSVMAQEDFTNLMLLYETDRIGALPGFMDLRVNQDQITTKKQLISYIIALMDRIETAYRSKSSISPSSIQRACGMGVSSHLQILATLWSAMTDMRYALPLDLQERSQTWLLSDKYFAFYHDGTCNRLGMGGTYQVGFAIDERGRGKLVHGVEEDDDDGLRAKSDFYKKFYVVSNEVQNRIYALLWTFFS